ncbi:MAG: YcnI family protein [Gemmobacter sp.]
MKKTLTALAVLALSAPAALAHATFEQREVTHNVRERMVLRIPHGCGDEATLRVRVSIPDGINAVQPMVKAGWTLSTVRGPLAQPYHSHGMEVTEGVREIIWEGELPSEFYDEFVFRARFTEALPAGEMVHIPVVQECANGAERWIEIPAAGQSAGDLRYPAPAVRVMAPAAHGHSHGHSHGN